MRDGDHLTSRPNHARDTSYIPPQQDSIHGSFKSDHPTGNSYVPLDNGYQLQQYTIPLESQWAIPPPTHVKPNVYANTEYLPRHESLAGYASTDLTPSSVSTLSYTSKSSLSASNGCPTRRSSIPTTSSYSFGDASGSYEDNHIPVMVSLAYSGNLSASQNDTAASQLKAASNVVTVPIQTSTSFPERQLHPSSFGDRSIPIPPPSSKAEPSGEAYTTLPATRTHEIPSMIVNNTATHTPIESQAVLDRRSLIRDYLHHMRPMNTSSSSRVSRADLLSNNVSRFASPSEDMVPLPSFESTEDTAAVVVSWPPVFSLPPRIKRGSKNVSRNLQSLDCSDVLNNDSSGIQSPTADEVPIPAAYFSIAGHESAMHTSSQPGLPDVLASRQVMDDYTWSPSTDKASIPAPYFSSENKSTMETSQPYFPLTSGQVMGHHTRVPGLQISKIDDVQAANSFLNPQFIKVNKKAFEEIPNEHVIPQSSEEFEHPGDVDSMIRVIKSFDDYQHFVVHPNISQVNTHARNAFGDCTNSFVGQSQVPIGLPPGLQHPRWSQPEGPIIRPVELPLYPNGNCECFRCAVPVQRVAPSGDSDMDLPSARLQKWLDEQQARAAGGSNGGG
ncbi:hypothetical protein ABKN59_009296 [Abortiporus biennis]